MPLALADDGTARLAELTRRFRQQQQFSTGYSPLYAALFGTVAKWLAEGPEDPVVRWLLKASADRPAFDVTNLLVAALHYEVLAGHAAVSDLAAYYPSSAEVQPADVLINTGDHGADIAPDGFARALRRTILARKPALSAFLQTKSVQTNETGRGIAWLLPICLAGWNKIHLLDLGASAGLNLIADQRNYKFVDVLNGTSLARLGIASPVQFIVHVHGQLPRQLVGTNCQLQILSRAGYDKHPFHLNTVNDQRILTSYIWADQVERLQRLKEAFLAFQQVQHSDVPVSLNSASLPDDLPLLLAQLPSQPQEPLVIYNTYVKIYLPQKGAKLRHIISVWAMKQNRPVVWLQWEPPQFTSLKGKRAPHIGWLAWTADIWHNMKHYQYHLAWVHPHGRELQCLSGFDAWACNWS